ncbi:hypothetical protein L2Y96_19070 [Luteibacter aegosomaticola]|uniref:hypothetical protein n=1 Tax=Luteibacter aegosomaticola TaxID=2911538 RepID=UPI001FFC0C4F|nr:hypothetical protein [Luteibacter aegosomaticola]UPG89474.1 hypothetical protein L2Y96_19070 [Luteibacter aegosomaticola]
MAIAKLYSDLSVPDRQLVSTKLGSSIRKKLLHASGRMAEEAMNDGDRRWIQIAVVLNVIEGFEVDYRENFRCMVLVRHAARYLGVDMAEVVEFAMTLASGQSKQQLEIFVSRDDTQNRIEKVEVGVERVDGRWRFVPKSR